jgi:hypothetical protein
MADFEWNSASSPYPSCKSVYFSYFVVKIPDGANRWEYPAIKHENERDFGAFSSVDFKSWMNHFWGIW